MEKGKTDVGSAVSTLLAALIYAPVIYLLLKWIIWMYS